MITNDGLLKAMVNGAYDLQALRMATGQRLCANFRAKLGLLEPPDDEDDVDDVDEDGEKAEAKKILKELRDHYRSVTAGIVAKGRELPPKHKFKGDEIISDFSELVLINQFLALESQEKRQFRQMEPLLEDIPVYRDYLANVHGVGPAMAGVLITGFDVHKAPYPSSFWKYAGIDVVGGKGRSRREEHLVDRQYKNKKGEIATRKSVTYNPWVKTKLVGVLASSFIKLRSDPWRQIYDNRKHRMTTNPNIKTVTLAEWKKRFNAEKKRRDAGKPPLDLEIGDLWTPGRLNNDAKRYMVKMFLVEFHGKWRAMEGYPPTLTYQEAKLGHVHREAAE